MNINLIAIGQKMPLWVKEGYQQYASRIRPPYSLKLITPLCKSASAKMNPVYIAEQQGKCLLASIPKDSYIVALDLKGHMWNSKELAKQLINWQQKSRNVSLLVGGACGLDQQCLTVAKQHWSLSALTLPHMLVRVIIAEQIYRAYSLIHQHPYHK